jgi:D-aspartate ligase
MVDRLVELARKVGGRPVLIPTDDHYAQALARHRAELETRMIACVASSDVVELLVDQLRFCRWARTHGVDCPQSAPADGAQLPFAPPVVAKPINFTDFLLTARNLPVGEKPSDLRFTIIRSENEWQAFRRRYAPHLHKMVVQEYVSGSSADMFSIGIYADRKAQVRAIFVGRKLRGYPAQYGNTILGQNDCVPEQILDEVESIVQQLGYTGIAEFEYRREPETGKFRLIEINPRCWSWILATAFSRANIPWIAYRDLCGEPVERVIENEAPGSIKAVRVMSDLANVFWRYRSDEPAWLMTPRAWWRSLAAKKLALVEFGRGDWLVSLFCFALLLRDLIKNEH